MTKHEERQRLIRYYRQVTGITDVDMKEVAKFAVAKMGWKLPKPTDPYELLGRQFSDSAREETRRDKKTGRPYRANHQYIVNQGDQTIHLWIDIDEPTATRKKMHMSLTLRREQMVSDGLQLTFDAEHWNSANSNEEPIQMIMDLTDDVEWRKNGPDEMREAG
jgi:hypothetical protein